MTSSETTSETTFQALLARFLTDPARLLAARENPDAFAQRESLAPEDVRRLLAMRPAGLLTTSWVAMHKTREQIRCLYPATITAASSLPEAGPLLEYGPAGGRLDRPEEAAAVGRGLRELAAQLNSPVGTRRAALLDLIRFESLWYEAKAALPSGPRTADRPATGPRLRPGSVLAGFGCEVVKAHRLTLEAGELVDMVTEPTAYVVAAGTDDRVSTVRLPPSAHDLLAACDGSVPVSVLSARFGHPIGHIERLLTQLARKGIVVLPDAAGRRTA
ncbi:hypothetical protein [Streptomyces coelicoflavus]|uniref:hypothetical protein n=1 Tax=Streptomyces coelicoflavus TaxID=285562 RepID=UPI002E276F88